MVRRAIWNLLKIEYENYYRVYDFKSFGGIHMPYKVRRNSQIDDIVEKVFGDFLQIADPKFKSDFLIDKAFHPDYNKAYIKKYKSTHNVEFSKELYDQLNKSFDQDEMDQFLTECKMKNKIMENELNSFLVLQQTDSRVEVNQKLNKLKKSQHQSFVKEKFSNISSNYIMEEEEDVIQILSKSPKVNS